MLMPKAISELGLNIFGKMAGEDLQRALHNLRKGKIVLIYEPEERETSMVAAAEKIDLDTLKIMKKHASGDIGVAMSYALSKRFGLPFMTDVLKFAEKKFQVLKRIVPRERRSSFSLLLDHANCRTGSSDKDKLLLIKGLVDITRSGEYGKFSRIVRAPGHLKFFIASENLLRERRGHTEMSIAMMRLAGMCEIAVICSMRDEKTGLMLSKGNARRYAEENDLSFLDGEEIIEAYNATFGEQTGGA